MHHFALLFLVFLLLPGCTSRDLAGPEHPGEPLGTDNRAETVIIRYEVTGTYARCDVTYTTANRQKRTVKQVALAWSSEFAVTVNGSSGPFDAHLTATCADVERTGKSYVYILVNGEVRDQGQGVGFGATAEAREVVGNTE